MATKSVGRRAAPVAAKIKTSMTLSAEAYSRLGAAVVKEGMSQGEIVEWMIGRLLSGYCVVVRGERILSDSTNRPDRAAGVTTDDRREAADQISDPAAIAA